MCEERKTRRRCKERSGGARSERRGGGVRSEATKRCICTGDSLRSSLTPFRRSLIAMLKESMEDGGDDQNFVQIWTKRDRPDVCSGLSISYVWVMVWDGEVDDDRGIGRPRQGRGRGVRGLLSTENRKVPRIQLRWNAPRNNGYPLSGYIVERRVGDDVDWDIVGKSKVQNYIDTVRDVGIEEGGGTVVYRVSAANKLGTGKVSEEVEVVVSRRGTRWTGGGQRGGWVEEEEEEEEEGLGETVRQKLASSMALTGGTMSIVQPGMVADWRKLQKAKKRRVQRK